MIQKTKKSIPSFTIVIPVIHSLEDLERCLSSLDSLDYPKEDFQVVLVDCHVVHGLKQFFTEKLLKCGFRVRTLSLPELSTNEASWFTNSRLNEARNYVIQRVPGRCYVFTLDDCTFKPDWLHKFKAALTDEVGALGGPEILPEGMAWFPRALDCVLNSYLATAGTRRGDGLRENQYYPRKENMAIPARVLDHVGDFPEEKPVGGEMAMARRIRDAGFRIRFLPDNPVWHRRVTNFPNFVRLTAYMAFEKVKLMREQHVFIQTPHFLVLLAIIVGTLLGLFSLVSGHARVLLAGIAGAYLVALLSTAVFSAVHTRSVVVSLGVFLLIPIHHLSLMFGIIKGAVIRIANN